VSPASVSTLQIYEKAATVGVSHDVYVIARDAYGNIATSYDGTVHFSSSDTQAVLPPDSTISNGLGYFPVTMMNPGPQTITVTDTADSALTTTVNVTYAPPPTPPAPPPPPPAPAPSESYSISGPTSAAAGTALTYTVTVVDSNGNVVTDYAGTLKFYSTDKQAVLPAAYTFTSADAGVHTFSVTLNTAGPQTIYFIDSATTAIHGYVRVNVSGGTATDSYEISGPTSATAGAAQTYTVSVVDANGNVVTNYAGTLKFYSTDHQAVLPADYSFTSDDAGVHTFSVTLNTVGGQSLYFIDSANTSIHGYIRVNVTTSGSTG
jgi:hypothetical protein